MNNFWHRIRILAALLLFANVSLSAQEYKVSLLTCAPSNFVYTTFGHTALRVVEVQRGIDLVFNYGMFDFSDDFVWRFVKGETDYELGVENFTDFYLQYYFSGRQIYQQTLCITPQEAQQLFDSLLENARPERRTYRYSFVYDNCATRPFDMIENVLPAPLVFTQSYTPATFRQLIHHNTETLPWLRFGIDLALGQPLDTLISYRNTFFIPSRLQVALDSAYRTLPDGEVVPLVQKSELLTDLPPLAFQASWLTPWVASMLFCLLISLLSLWGVWRGRRLRALDVLLFSLYGAGGAIIFFLMTVSVHPVIFPNVNGWWLHPFYWVLIPLLWGRGQKWLPLTACLLLLSLALFLFVHAISIQQIPPAVYPLVLAMALRLVLIICRNDSPPLM